MYTLKRSHSHRQTLKYRISFILVASYHSTPFSKSLVDVFSTWLKVVFFKTDNPIPADSNEATTIKAMEVGTMYPKNSATILLPMNPRTTATAGSKYSKSAAAFERTV